MNNLLEQLQKITSAKFVSLTYRSKGTNELARHTILLGVNHEKAYQKDLSKLLTLQPRLDGLKKQACEELILSLKNSLEKGIGENDSYTCKGVYENLPCKGLKLHKEKAELHLLGYTVQKTVIEQGEHKEVKSKPLTIAKNELRLLGRLSKIRQFVLNIENIKEVKINGKNLEFVS